MTGFSPNYFIPYAQVTDPADVPFYLQGLAERVDEVLNGTNTVVGLDDKTNPRHMAQVFGTIPNTLNGTAVSGTLTWQLTDFNTNGNTPGTPAIVQLGDASTTAIQVNHPGFWFVFGTVQAANTVVSANIDELGVEILHNGSATPTNCRSGTHDTVNAADPTVVIDASCGLLLAAGDTVGLRGLVRRASGAAQATFRNRSLTLLRMTLS